MDISKIKIDNSVLDVKDTTARSTLQLLGTASVKDAPASGNASNSQVVLGNDTRLSDPRPASDVYEWAKASTKPTYTKSEVGLGNVTNDSQVKRSEMGVASGVATLDSTGKVPSTQLPSYVDDVIEGYMYNGKFYAESTHETLITGESGKIYSDLSTNKIYRWGGSAFAVISETLAVGTTQGTAFDGKSGYDHVNNTNNPHSVTKSQVGLGNVGNFKAVSTVASQGLTDAEKSNARANIGAGTSSFSGSYDDLIDKPAIPEIPLNNNGHDYVEIGGIKWATMNIGANSITDTGLYFQWGDTQGYTAAQVGSGEGQKYFGWADYKYGNGTSSPGATGMTKYNSTDGKTVLDASDDAVTAAWGGTWRTPTTAEFQALGNAVNTAWTANYQGSGVAGLVLTDKTDSSKVLFFPAAGYCEDGGVNYAGGFGFYWSSSVNSSDVQNAYGLYFKSSRVLWQYDDSRYYGYAVRGVLDDSTSLHKVAVTGDYNDLNHKPSYTLDEVSDGSTRKLADKIGKTINTTWANLKSLRDNSQLVPGQFYRITDYATTTTQTDTQSTGHQFDIIVRADDVNVLNENAYAAKHAGDTYFANSKLESWELKYCIDNDTNRFTWADTTNGKGVVYRMIDEFNNDVHYDFKNIQFKRWKVTDSNGRYGINNKYMGANSDDLPVNITVPDTSDFIWAYTFSSSNSGGSQTDKSLLASNNVYNNVIKNYVNGLNNNVFFGDRCYSNTFGNECFNNTFGTSCINNSFGKECSHNTFGDENCNNSFGNMCCNNSFGYGCCYSTLGCSCKFISFGDDNYNISFVDACENNTLGSDCGYNSFGNDNYNNSFGDSCCYNTLGSSCCYNSLGRDCCYNSLGSDCQHNTLSKSYSENNIIENGNKYITLTSTQSTSFSKPLRNIKICQGVNNTSTTKTISHNTVHDTFLTEYKPANSQVISV